MRIGFERKHPDDDLGPIRGILNGCVFVLLAGLPFAILFTLVGLWLFDVLHFW